VLGENKEDAPLGSDTNGLSADLIEAARRRNLSANSLAAFGCVVCVERIEDGPWKLAWMIVPALLGAQA
jgi:hypothetical protein